MTRALRRTAACAALLVIGCRSQPKKPAPSAASASASAATSPSSPAAMGTAPAASIPLIEVANVDNPPLCLEDGWCWKSPLPQANGINGVWGSGSQTWAVGKNGTILRHDGRVWSLEQSGTNVELGAVSGTSDTNVWAAGGRSVLRFDGKRWQRVGADLPHKLTGIWVGNPERAVVVGKEGLVAVCSPKACRAKESGTKSELKGVWGQGDHAFAVGRNGVAVHGVGDEWTAKTIADTPYLRAVWGSNPTRVFAVGTPGTPLYRYDGKSWKAEAGGTGETRARYCWPWRKERLDRRGLRGVGALRRSPLERARPTAVGPTQDHLAVRIRGGHSGGGRWLLAPPRIRKVDGLSEPHELETASSLGKQRDGCVVRWTPWDASPLRRQGFSDPRGPNSRVHRGSGRERTKGHTRRGSGGVGVALRWQELAPRR